MKKTLIALAVAGVVAAPAAMAEVTISGGLQAEVVSVGGDGSVPTGLYAMDGMQRAYADPTAAGTFLGGQNSGNYGFLKAAAAEDLGGGMKALASYNMQIAVDKVLSTRDAFIGLSTGFGTVLAGRLSTPYKSATVSWDPFLQTVHQARGNIGMSILNNGYVNNAVAYANSFGGVKVVAAVVLDEAKSATDAKKTNGKNATSFSVNAPIGPVELAVGYINVSEFGSINNTGVLGTVKNDAAIGKNAAGTKVGVKWAGGPVTVAAQVEMLDKGLTGSGETGNVIWANVGYKLDDANTLTASFGQEDKKVTGTNKAGTYMAVGAFHALSKTTSAWVAYSASDDTTTYNATTNPTGGKLNAASVGMRVNF